MAAASKIFNAVTATDTCLPSPHSRGANSLYIQRLVVNKTSSTQLPPGLVFGLGSGLSSRNALTLLRRIDRVAHRKRIARVFSDQAFTIAKEAADPNGAEASVSSDDQLVHGEIESAANEESSSLGLNSTSSFSDQAFVISGEAGDPNGAGASVALDDQLVRGGTETAANEESSSLGLNSTSSFSDQAFVIADEAGNPNGAEVSVGLDDELVRGRMESAANEESSSLGMNSTSSKCTSSDPSSVVSNASEYHGSNDAACHENNGAAKQRKNAGGNNGAADNSGNGALHSEHNSSTHHREDKAEDSVFNSSIKEDKKSSSGLPSAVMLKEPSVTGIWTDTTAKNRPTSAVAQKGPSLAFTGADATMEDESAAAGISEVPVAASRVDAAPKYEVAAPATQEASIRDKANPLDLEFQSEKDGSSGTTSLKLYSPTSDLHKKQRLSPKGKVDTIGQEDPWFKQVNRVKTPVSVGTGGRWNQFKTYSTIQRTCEIWFFVATFLFKAWSINQKFSYKGGITEEKKKEKQKVLAKWLKDGLLRLGPTFIKIGQQFSTRVDILPQEYVDQLSELQDQVPPFESDIALKIVEEELGAPAAQIFDQFDPDPVAAASLGQVHRAILRGKEIVVKVQRPGLKDLFDIDLKNLRVIAENLQKLDPKSDGAKRDWVAIYDECAAVLYQEIDYSKEGANAERFASNFKDIDYVKVPKIYWEFTTPQVLTMEYVPGIKINRIAALDQLGVDRKLLARYAVESYLEQILRHGFFHADPHPGNIAVDDENGGRLIFYDFGMMGSISPNIRTGLLEAFYGVYEKDPDKVLQAMVQMGVLVPTGDLTAVRRTAQFFLSSFENRLASQRAEREAATTELGFKKSLSKEEKVEKKKLRLAAIGEDLLSISVDQPFRFPATFTFVVRAFSVLDGIGKGLDPRFDISEIAKPYALEILKFREFGYEVLIRDFKKRWNRQAQAFSNLFRQADRVEKLAEVIQRIEQGDLKLRVRTLESERAFKRVAAVQQTIGQAILAATLLNLATMLHFNAIRVPSLAAFIGSALFGLKVLLGLVKVKKLDKQEKLITGTA